MLKESLLIILTLSLLFLLCQNYQARKELVQNQQKLTTFNQQKTNWAQEKRQLETKIYHTDRDIVKARKDFWQLRLLINEWNVFKGIKEIKELVEKMRSNPLCEEPIN